jgi:hypothetical protein
MTRSNFLSLARGLFPIFAAALLLGAGGAGASDSAYPALTPLRVSGGRIVDANGSTVIPRGVCVNQLGDYFQANPKVPSTIPLYRRDFEQMAEIGIDSVRLIITWSALEPERGRFDRAYLDRVKEAVGWARDNGIYVVLDMHQDSWGKYIVADPDVDCKKPLLHNIGWDGAPEWATITDGKNRCMLIHREFSLAGWRAWQSFWTNRDGIQDRFIATWAWVASEFKDDPTVAGYDLLNEPNWGEDYLRAVYKWLPEFHGKTIKAIRQAEGNSPPKLVFFEPIIVWSVLPGSPTVKFTDDPNIVYAPHIYLGSISLDMFLLHREIMPLRSGYVTANREAAAYGTTFWNGEWMPGPGDHPFRLAALEDEFQVGGARWIWKSSCGDPHRMIDYWPARDQAPEGELNNVIVTSCGDAEHPEGVDVRVNEVDRVVLSRPYPRAFPSPATFAANPRERTLEMNGVAPRAGIPLTVWIPGAGEPTVKSEGLENTRLGKVTGGWIIEAAPAAGTWSLSVRGRD